MISLSGGLVQEQPNFTLFWICRNQPKSNICVYILRGSCYRSLPISVHISRLLTGACCKKPLQCTFIVHLLMLEDLQHLVLVISFHINLLWLQNEWNRNGCESPLWAPSFSVAWTSYIALVTIYAAATNTTKDKWKAMSCVGMSFCFPTLSVTLPDYLLPIIKSSFFHLMYL